MRTTVGFLFSSSALLSLVALAGAATPQDSDTSGPSLTQRASASAPILTRGMQLGRATQSFPVEYRSITGVGNNLANPGWGSANSMLLRMTPNAYEDGSAMPARQQCLSARQISNMLAAEGDLTPNSAGASDFLWQWGQFLDHDITVTPIGEPFEVFNIEVPQGDPWFDPNGVGTVTIGLERSAWKMQDSVRQQMNENTAFIDASNVYGSDDVRAAALRTMDGTGRLRTSDGDLLPYNTEGLPNVPDADPSLFLAGDIRANEQVGLTAMHTLFVREHNHWADVIRGENPALTGDEVYDRARAIVSAEMQAITYNEFLPMLLGRDALPRYLGYRDDVNAGIANEFATAAYRVGHTLLSPKIRRIDASGATIPAGDLALADAFFRPAETVDYGIEPTLRGLASQAAQQIDNRIVDGVRNFLFGPPGAGGFDLAALNIQRGRDHGLASYNTIRTWYGVPTASSFADVTSDPTLQESLAAAYESVDDIDPWIGLLAEDHAPGAMVGETLRRVLVDQFTRLRDGDRFYYESYLPPRLVALVNAQRLSTIIRRNTDIGSELHPDVFRVRPGCVADIDHDGAVGPQDLAALVSAFGRAGGSADVDGDGVVGSSDLAMLLARWGACR
jgi:hypothetical protein